MMVLVLVSLVEIEYLRKPEAVARPGRIDEEIHELRRRRRRNGLASRGEDHTFHGRCDGERWRCQTIGRCLEGSPRWACRRDRIGAGRALWVAGGQLRERCEDVLHFF